ncbi:multiple C2 and transmembrane domain-containing protein-like isoform X3 [Trichoplusia ni]|uniref:Multiple C2 and transmembrane domain-containing protein-like isoform X3 n=1 Tax=Trichoplusia ni TaxID=7111 RepID=A0A7E5VGI2_TRINI|nr:multiple C2 and transmembrane domain-containing protein-like isoform X3 [Trichoplusia ni]XP_026727346.1 multiple C2 and transmembrane domain-containing protein-like isoform X3 [Trichoplusia ni]
MWSLAIPDGLVMDPLAPTALAVSSEFMDRIGSGLTILRDHGKKVQKYVWKNRKFDILKKSWKSIVNVVLIDAKDTPSGSANGLYCKFKLGNENHKSKQLSKSKQSWCERFNLYLYDDNNLEVTVWHKGKQKSFMGRCVIDLSQLEKEKTHELWQDLECGQGSIHLLITMSGSARTIPLDNVPTTNGVHHMSPEEEKFQWYRLDNSWGEVGELSVTVYGAEGLNALGISGKADSYCVLELDNSRIRTHTVPGSSDPTWNKSYTFPVNDVTSMLTITVKDESIINTLKDGTLGKISIPLLTIVNDEKAWFDLNNKAKKSVMKGNSAKIQLQMSIAWNPIKASFRLLSPKTNKYTETTPKTFNIPMIYNNLKFIKDIFYAVHYGNEHLKYLFEWDNREKSALALTAWLLFWFFFRMWMTPLLAVIPFVFFWATRNTANLVPLTQFDEESSEEDLESAKDDKTIKTRLYELQDLTFTIKDGIDFIVSLLQRVKNLFKFAVPYLSYLVMTALIAATVAIYIIPINYIFMALGIYKFMRKVLYPDRIPNNDILDFISRIPDDKMLKQWRELRVPETNFNRTYSAKRR